MTNRAAAHRRGIVLLVVIVCIGLAAIIFVSVLKLVAAQQRLIDTDLQRAQARWLAESAIQRATARLAVDPTYRGETWDLSAEELALPDGGRVTIQVQSVPGQSDRRLVRVQADYPNAPDLRARQTQERTVPMPTPMQAKP